MPRIIHGADFHLDSPFTGLPPEKARQRRRESRELLEKLGELAKKEQAELVLLSGDLFDGERVYPETVERLRAVLGGMGCPVFIAPGNHDPYTSRSPYAAGHWPDNVHIFRSAQIEAVELPELNCVVYGCAFTGPERTDQALSGFAAPADGRLHLMCLHGDMGAMESAYGPITREQAAAMLVRLYDRLYANSSRLASAGSNTKITVDTPAANEDDELPTTPLEPIAELYAQLRKHKSSGTDMSRAVLCLTGGGVRTITSNGRIVSTDTLSAQEVEKILSGSGVHTYYSTRYESAYCIYKPNSYQSATLWYQSEESLAAKLQLARLFGVTRYTLN